MRKTILASAVLASLFAVAPVAFAEDAPAAAETPAFTGNFGIFSDYRFRGISQTKNAPALQGGFDYAHSSGLYVGTWASSISSNQYYGGNGMELDVYGGYKTEVAEGLGLDVGFLQYYYSGADYNKAQTVANRVSQKFDNQEIYTGLAYGPFTAKVSYALTDYFGLNSATSGTSKGSSKGTVYYDLGFTQEVAAKTNVVAHVGYTSYKNYSEFNYTDYKLGVTYDLNGYILGATYYGNSLKEEGKGFNTLTDDGSSTKLYKDTVVLSVSKTF